MLVLLCGAAAALALASPALGAWVASGRRVDRSVQTDARAKPVRPEAGIASDALAANFTKTDTTIAMDDGVQIAATLYEPTGTPPAAGWPAIMMFHGLGGKRQDMNTLAENSFANEGYAVFTFDTRGNGE